MLRRLAAALAALAMVVLLAAPAIAGGWAEIVADAQTAEPPAAGQPVEIGFRVMQHGETPAGWETPTVHFTNLSTGAIIDVVATNDRADGHFSASAVLPEAGYWSWQVTLQDLIAEHQPIALTVLTATGQMPAYDPSTTAIALAKLRADLTNEMNTTFLPEIERLDGLVAAEQATTSDLSRQVDAITTERDELATRLAAAEGGGSQPLLAVVVIAVLAGATAGFAMTWLAGRPGPSVTFSPTQREADQA